MRMTTLEQRALPSSSIPLSTVNWTALGPAPLLGAQTPGSFNVAGRAAGLAVDPGNPDVVYVGTAGGGVWKTTNATAANPSWTPLTDNQASEFIGCVTLAPSNSSIVYVGTGEEELRALSFYGKGVLKSTDAGATWTLLGNSVFDRTVIGNIVVHPTNPNIVFAAIGNHGTDCNPAQATGVFRSTDGGVTWTNLTTAISTTDDYTTLIRDPTDPNVMWTGVGTRLGSAANGIYKTTNALAATPTWTLVSNLPFGSTVGRTRIAIAPSNNQVLYVAMSDPAGNLLKWYQSTNGGTSWIDRTSVTPGTDRMWYSLNLLVDPTNANIVYWSGTTNLLRSTTGGASWTAINSGADGKGPHVDHHGFAMDSAGRFLDVSDGGAWRYTPSTNLWADLNGTNTGRNASTALNTIQFMGIAISPTDPDFVIGGTQDNGLARFSDSLGWTLAEGGDGGDVIMDPFNSSQMWRANPVGSYGASAYVRRSTDGGNSWVSIVNGISSTSTAAAAFYPPMAADPGTPNRIFFGADVLYVSTNAGTNWTRLPGDTFTFPHELRAIAVGPTSSSTIYVSCGASADGTANAYGADQLFVTTNDGVTWTDRTPQAGGDYQKIVVDPTNSNVAYAVNANFSPTGDNIFRTTNAGQTWTSISTTLIDAPFYDLVLDPGPTPSSSDDVLYAGGDQGVYRSTDLGATWSKFGNGLPISQVRDLEFAPQTKILAAATHGRGVWEILTGIPNVPGQISGTVYNDQNANAKLDAGEPGLGGWTVFRDDNNNGMIDNYGTSTINATGLPVNIPDAGMGMVNSTLNVSGVTGAVTNLKLQFNITHTYDADLVATLISPAGTKIALFTNVGGSGQNFNNTILDDQAAISISAGTAPFAGSYQPQGLLSSYIGQNPNGTWTLAVTDVGPGDTGTLNSWSLIATTGEEVTVTKADGSYTLPNSFNGTYNVRRVLQSGWFGTEPIGGVQVVSVPAGQGVTNVNFGQTQHQPVKVASVVVNNGDPQRSRVTQVQVNFDQLVTLPANPANAFQLKRQSDNAVIGLTASVTNTTTTSVTLTFSGPTTEFTSLADGRYTLTVSASQVSNSFGQLDGNGDGVAGDDYTLIGAPGTAPSLFRLFGDITGDGSVNANDFILFRQYFGGYIFAFDFDGDNAVAASDFTQFRLRFGGSI
jgi:subtilisin-like proprotein convertase family protein